MTTGNKRSIITPERLARLTQPNAVYTISCFGDEYFCPNHEKGCYRGFFSLYLQVIYGIMFANRVGLPYHIDFGNVSYRYSNEKSLENRNFWNYYFEQEPMGKMNVHVFNVRHENYPLRIWSRSFISTLHKQAVAKIFLKPDIRNCIDQVKSKFGGLRMLGIHIRRTDHFHEVKPPEISNYFKAVDRWIKDYDQIFVATDDGSILNDFISRYPQKVIFNSATRSSGNLSVHADIKTDDRYLLGKEALIDCYSLASCNRVILSSSNLSYAALLLNPDLDFEIVESWPARLKRWKTLFVYLLDQWNIRKW